MHVYADRNGVGDGVLQRLDENGWEVVMKYDSRLHVILVRCDGVCSPREG